MTPDELLDSLDEPRRSQARELHALISAETARFPIEVRGDAIWYGLYRYRYATGREGDTGRVVLAPAKRGPASISARGSPPPVAGADCGVGCVRIKDLKKVDIEALCREVRRVATNEPTTLKKADS